MFSASAELYDLIYSGFKDFAAETAQLAALIRAAHPAARRVLDVACGTAEHARAIGYVRTLDNVRRALERFRMHLEDGGIVIVEPWFTPGVLEAGRVMVHTAEGDGVTVCRMSHCVLDGQLSRLRFEYLIGRPTGIERASEVHELGLFTVEEMQDCFRQAGLEVTYDPKGPSGRGLYVARQSMR